MKSLIHNKLELFLRKYYINECIKGLLLFIAIGFIYFFIIVFFEYFFWLNTLGRKLLFFTFVSVELFLFYKFIVLNLLYLFKIKKGINYEKASLIIGSHFSEIKDKLSNFLQLNANTNQNELLLAAIAQKESQLSPLPFNNAINYKKIAKILPFTILTVFIYLLFLISGNNSILNLPFQRIISYNKEFKKPAPFTFKILNSNLNTFYNKDFTLNVKISGKILPENISINYNNQVYLLKYNESTTFYQYTFLAPKKDIDFFFEAQNVFSDSFSLKVSKVPIVNNLQLILNYPSSTLKKSEVINGTGNVIIPEGTNISWKINSLYTSQIDFLSNSKKEQFQTSNNKFSLTKKIKSNLDYSIVTSNDLIKNYEQLNFNITVIKDQFPTISVDFPPDSLNVSKDFLIGQITDDYGFSKLQLVYYPKDKPNFQKKLNLKIKSKNQDNFIYRFPDNLNLENGVFYDYYFEVYDNDATNNFKSSKSQIFSNKVLSNEELIQDNFISQQSNMNQLSKSINNQNKQLKELDKIQQINKQKPNLDFKDKNKIDEILKNQLNQEKIIEDFSKKLKENINQNKENFDKDLEKKLDKAIENSEENQKLLEEIKQLQDKISKEDLFDKINKSKSNSKSNQKNLEQLLELTKKFYVEKKFEQLANKLDKLGDKEDKLSNDENNSKEKQESINKEFNKLTEELKELKKDNEELKKPLDIKDSKEETNDIKEDQQNATEDLNENKKEEAKKKQKSAAKKMKSLAAKMKSNMQSSSMEQMEEDAEMLRQILDNLLSFSFNQEQLLKSFKEQKRGFPSYNNSLKKQQNLKLQFKHIDDSIFALALRNKMISEKVNNEIAEVHYNTDKALAELAEFKISKGTSHQQYIMNASNKLADMLSETLNSMQMQMNASGSGSGDPKPGSGGKGGQLPDIIKKQKSLSKKMKEKSDSGEEEGDEGKDGDKGEDGQKGKEGKKGEDGEDGENGSKGENGTQGSKGNKGKNGNGKNGSGGKSENKNGNDGEENAKELIEILQEQKKLRQQLQDIFSKNGIEAKQKKLLDDMKAVEKDILNKGFNNEIFKKMLNIENQMLKLENATNLQEEDNKRESNTNKQSFNNNNKLPESLIKYIQSNEILQKNSLPLNNTFIDKLNFYFNKND